MRYDPLFSGSLPYGSIRGELHPGRAQFHVIWGGSPSNSVDTVRNALHQQSLDEPVDGVWIDSGPRNLTACDESPLVFRDGHDAREGRAIHTAFYHGIEIFCSTLSH